MKIKRFSYGEDLIKKTDQGINNSIDFADSVSARLLEDRNLGQTRGVQRWGRLVNNTAKFLKRNKKKNGMVDNRK